MEVKLARALREESTEGKVTSLRPSCTSRFWLPGLQKEASAVTVPSPSL